MGCNSSNMAMTPSSTLKTEAAETQDFHSKYTVAEKLGRGSYGQVHLVHRKDVLAVVSGERAVKIRNLRSPKSGGKRDAKVCKSSFNEVCVWSRVGEHANCVQLFESFFDAHLGYMVMEKCHQNLVDYVTRLPIYSERSLSEVFAQMLQGISHLHSLRILHRDIKPDNFLVGGTDHHTIKLADFGLSVLLPEGQKLTHSCGTPPYMSPDMLQRKEYDLKSDLWSFGVVAYLFLYGKFPYAYADDSNEGVMRAIARGGRPKCNASWLSKEATSFLMALLERDSESRASADLALAMPFISGSHKWDISLKRVLTSAARKGGFDSAFVKEESSVDVIWLKLQEGMLESKTKRVDQHPIDEFLQADAHMAYKLAERFWFGVCPDVKLAAEALISSMSSKSTTCSLSGRSTNVDTSGSTNRSIATNS